MTINDLKEQGLILYECLSGSRAYGLATPSSDTDIKGVFILPKERFYALDYIPQISNSTNDIVYYELGRYIELLTVNNPNILELLSTPKDSILMKDPIMDKIHSELFISKICEKSFGKFALSQIKKAKGLNKKIVNPIDLQRKSVLDFCYVNHNHGSLPIKKYLEETGKKQEHCGLVKIPNMKDLYGLYYKENGDYAGIIKGETSNSVTLSAIPKGEKQIKLLYFNINGYSTYCKDYKEYWEWVENRNETRYQNTQSHGKNYDAKNMMHTFRLLEMAIEIAKEGKINVRRPDREFLLKVKSGSFTYDQLLKKASEKQTEMEVAFQNSNLQKTPDLFLIKALSSRLRAEIYAQ